VSVALVTNYLPGYRLPLYRLLAERLDVHVHCFGGEAHYVPASLRDLDRQIAEAPFPAHRLARERDAAGLGERYDAVIASTAGRVALAAAYLGARRSRRPFLLWASLWRHPRTPAHLVSLFLMHRLYRRSDAILTYGPHVSRYVARRRGTSDGVFEAPQAVEDLFACPVPAADIAAWRSANGLADGALVLFAGRLVADKGVDVLLRSWRRVEAEGAPGALCLAGEGPLAAELGRLPHDRVRAVGRIERSAMPVAYAAADVVVVPSVATRRFLEPWGLVCNEAMSQGRPVVATSAVGAAAGGLVRDGDTGAVVPAGDDSALAAALVRLLRDERLRERLGANAREAVRAFTYERAADAFARALDSAYASAGRRQR
jgi:glycosyltransferase involved in cell wall biosynthesis